MGNLRDESRELNSKKRHTKTFPIPEMESPGIVQQLRAGDIIYINSAADKEETSLRLLARSLVDESGNRLYTDKDLEEIAALPAQAYKAAVEASNELGGYGKDGNSKNSEASPGEDSAGT